MKGIKITIISLLSLLLVSCIQTQEIEKLGIINASGIDSLDDDQLEISLVVFQFSTQSEEITNLISGKGKTIKGALGDAEKSTIFRLAPGKVKLMVYGKEMAEKGILPSLDTIARDARLPDLMYLSVSKTTAKEILFVDEEGISTDIGQFLHGMIENHSRDHNIPRKTLQDFLRIYYDIGQDNVLPLFEIKENVPKLSAIAVFKGDKLVGQITNEEAVLINLMDRTVKENMLELSLPIEPFEPYLEKREDRNKEQKVEITVMIKKGKSKTKLFDKENLVFETDTTMELHLLEQSAGIKLDEPHVIKLMEKEVEKEMEDRFNKLLNKLKKLESDPFGYGRYYKSSEKGKNLTRKEWREKFPEIDVKFKVDADIIRHGVTD